MVVMQVPMALHAGNRQKLLDRMRAQMEAAGRDSTSGVIFLQGGEEQTRDCTDTLLPFRQESYFAYLFGVKEPGFFGGLDLYTGKSFLLCPRLSTEYAVWLGKIQPPSYFKVIDVSCKLCSGLKALASQSLHKLTHVTDELHEVLKELQRGRDWMLYLLNGQNTDSGNFSKPASFEGMEMFKTDLELLHPVLSECRVHKSKLELDVLRYVNGVSSEAHVQVMRMANVGMKEYQLESTFLYHVYMYGGCRYCSYQCTCATGENSSTLHYGHAAAPNDKVIHDGDMALLDMGAEYHFYGSDITCSFPVNGKFTEEQCIIYGAVLDAQKAVMGAMRPGVSWVDMHKLAEQQILQALKRAGIVKGEVEAMMDNRLGAVFMPHGLGHFLGIDTHDTGGYPKGTSRILEPGLQSLRTIRILEEGMVLTVEPGCYFIEPLLEQALQDPAKSEFIVKEVLEKFWKFGGVRLEDDVVVTADGCENLTKCPREIQDVEAVMAGGAWPLSKKGA